MTTTKELFTKPEFQSSFLGFCIDTTYKTLVSIFGRPNSVSDKYKTDTEWMLQTKTGLYFTLYNYKDGKNYNGRNGLEVKDITNWHVGVKINSDRKKVEELFKLLGLIPL